VNTTLSPSLFPLFPSFFSFRGCFPLPPPPLSVRRSDRARGLASKAAKGLVFYLFPPPPFFLFSSAPPSFPLQPPVGKTSTTGPSAPLLPLFILLSPRDAGSQHGDRDRCLILVSFFSPPLGTFFLFPSFPFQDRHRAQGSP